MAPPFGSQVIAQVLGHRLVNYPVVEVNHRKIAVLGSHPYDPLSYLLLLLKSFMGLKSQPFREQHFQLLAPGGTPEPNPTSGASLKNKDPGDPVDLDMDDMVVPEEKPKDQEEDVDEPIAT